MQKVSRHKMICEFYIFCKQIKNPFWELPQFNKRTTFSLIFTDERLKSFPLRSEKRQRYFLLPLLFNIVLEILASPIKQEKGNKWYFISERKKVRLFLCVGDMIFTIENPKEHTTHTQTHTQIFVICRHWSFLMPWEQQDNVQTEVQSQAHSTERIAYTPQSFSPSYT